MQELSVVRMIQNKRNGLYADEQVTGTYVCMNVEADQMVCMQYT